MDYYNSGSWIDANPTYITVAEEGVEIRKYDGPRYAPEPMVEAEPAPNSFRWVSCWTRCRPSRS